MSESRDIPPPLSAIAISFASYMQERDNLILRRLDKMEETQGRMLEALQNLQGQVTSINRARGSA